MVRNSNNKELIGLINREFTEHHFATSERSLLVEVRNGNTDVWRRKMSQKQLVYIAHGSSHFFGAERSSLTYKVNKTGPKMDACVTPIVPGRGLEPYLAFKDLSILFLIQSILFSTVACNATPTRPAERSLVTYLTLFPRNVSLGCLWYEQLKISGLRVICGKLTKIYLLKVAKFSRHLLSFSRYLQTFSCLESNLGSVYDWFSICRIFFLHINLFPPNY